MLNTKKHVAVDKLGNLFQSLSGMIIGRANILRQIKFALVCKEHVLLEGPPGTAKSFLVSKLFSQIRDCETFRIQCTAKMTEDSLVGPPNVAILREEGRFVHNIEGTLVTSHYGFIDEFLDLSKGALRSLLEILNERTFSRGAQREVSPLHTAIATTNFDRSNEKDIEAVLDRFMFRAKVTPLNKNDRRRMLKAEYSAPLPTISHREIDDMANAVEEVQVSDEILDYYLDLCSKLNLTDRKVKTAMKVLKASAVFNHRKRCIVEDLSALDSCFTIFGDTTSEAAFGAAMTATYGPAVQEANKKRAVLVVSARLVQLQQLMDEADSYEKAEAIAIEAREALAALVPLRTQSTAEGCSKCSARAEAILAQADTLYENRNA